MVSITSGAWPLSDVGIIVDKPGYLQSIYDYAGNSLKNIKNKMNIIFYLVKLYNIFMTITFCCYCVICSIIFGLASFISWKILWYLYYYIKKYIKKYTANNQMTAVKEESISQIQADTLEISQQLTESKRSTKSHFLREQGKCFPIF